MALMKGSKRLPWAVGELYHSPKAFPNERWTFWKDRFDVIKSRDDLREQTRS
jgi:hypothetical protein